jgi:septal ring factor EnvC (AmiA/AmiB activator)
MKITKTHQTKNLACGFAMIYERSKLDPEKVKVAKDRAARRKKTEAENAALKSKLTRLMEQLSYLATNIQQTFDD